MSFGNRRRLRTLAAFAVALCVLSLPVAADPPAASPLIPTKRSMPSFEAVTLAGIPLTSKDVQGKVVLVDFWGTWCAPCVAAVPSLRAMSRRMEKEPFVLLSVSTDPDEKTLRDFVAKHQMSWPQVWDERHQLARKFRIEGDPTYVLVNHQGEIVFFVRGWSGGIERSLSARVSAAIAAAKKAKPPAAP